MDAQELVIKDYLLQGILSGDLVEQDKLPSEYTIVDQFKVPRIKVRNVYTVLEKIGLIKSVKGVGRFVTHQQQPLSVVLSGDISFSQKMQTQTKQYKSVVTKFEQVPHNHTIYTKPNVKKEPLYLIERLRFIDDIPAAIHRSYVIVQNVPAIKSFDNRLTSMYQFYNRIGVNSFRSDYSHLSVIFPTEIDRQMLSCEVLVPLVLVESDNWDAEKNVRLEYTEILYRADRFVFEV